MATEKQIAANRLNAQKPRTVPANSNSRYNALKHGIYTERLIMREEKAEDLAELAAEYHEQYAPANPTERALVDTLINNEWRQRRLRRVEAELWQRGRNLFVVKTFINTDIDPSNTCTSGDAYAADPGIFDRLQRVVNACERNYHRALKELRLAQAQLGQALPPAGSEAPQPMETTATSADLATFRQIPNPAPPAPPPPAPDMGGKTFHARLAEMRVNAIAKHGRK